MAQAEEQARQFLKQAEKKMSPKRFFQSLFGFHTNRTEDAIACYQKAGSLFKLSKNWLQAGSAFKIAGDLNLEHSNPHDAANDYVHASKCLEKYDLKSAVNLLLNAIQIYTDLGRFVMVAKLHNNIAEIYEYNVELQQALQHYEQAADFFKVEESYSAAKRCLLKIAHYKSSEFQDYHKAINIYQEIAFYDLKTPVLQYSAKDSLFKAVMCHLCVDIQNAQYALDTYVRKYPAFNTSREYTFLKAIKENVEESDECGFIKTVKEYDEISRLDDWHTKILLEIKKQIKDQPDLL